MKHNDDETAVQTDEEEGTTTRERMAWKRQQSCQTIDDTRWQIYKTIDNLQKSPKTFKYQSLTPQVVNILNLWAKTWAGQSSWQSFLNKRSFQHEIEESMVALYYLDQWRRQTKCKRFVAVDVCGGKGVFTMLLQYMASLYWVEDQKLATLDHVILLEKETCDKIDWRHLKADPPENNLKLVSVQLWQDTNLHHWDALIDRFQELSLPLAFTGIHLCKMLSPALIGLVNLLGDQSQYLCLAPCCMPRVVTSKRLNTSQRNIHMFTYESREERQERRIQQKRRESARRKNRSMGHCILCESDSHWLRQCPELPANTNEQSRLLQAAAAAMPCWNCGRQGHVKSNCSNEKAKPREPPVVTINVSSVLESSYPLHNYCELMSSTLHGMSVQVVETGLESDAKHQYGNWNSARKSLFIIAK